MTKLTKKQVLHVAELSNLTLSSVEIKKFTPQLTKIIDFIAKLSEVDTNNILPTSQTTNLVNVTREDKVVGENIEYNDYFKVKAIM